MDPTGNISQDQRFAPTEPGEYLVRIVPSRAPQSPILKYGMHYGIDAIAPNAGERPNVACRRFTLGDWCFACDVIFEATRSDVEINHERRQKMERSIARRRLVANVIDMKHPERGVLFWDFSWHVLDLLVPALRTFRDIVHPETGRILKVTYEPWREWVACKSIEPLPEPEPIPVPTWREDRHDLEAYVRAQLLTNDELKALFDEATGEEITAGV